MFSANFLKLFCLIGITLQTQFDSIFVNSTRLTKPNQITPEENTENFNITRVIIDTFSDNEARHQQNMSALISSQLRFSRQVDAETVVNKQSYKTSISTVSWTDTQWAVDISSLTWSGALCWPDTGPRYTISPCQPISVSCQGVSNGYGR